MRRSWRVSAIMPLLWWTVLTGLAWLFPLALEDEYLLYTVGLHGFKVVNFTTASATKESYRQFIEALRTALGSEYKRHEIPVLRELQTVADAERFLLVKLSNQPGGEGAAIALALDVINANVVAYQAGRQSYFFSDAPDLAFHYLFTRTEKKNKLPFGAKYAQLERAAAANRMDIHLGILALDEAISSLHRSSRTQEKSLAHSLLVIMQMVAEAARFRNIEQQVRFSIRMDGYQSFLPDASILALQTNWIPLSAEIQESNQGAFSHAVQLRRANGQMFSVDSVSGILKANLGFLQFICRAGEPDEHVIRPVVANDYDETCLEPEPTIRIIGRNGLCVDVSGDDYTDGNPIILYTCKSTESANQLWTLKRDGTIQSKGKCLTTYNYGPESYVMIYNCSTAAKSTTLWVLDAGSIINPESLLSLSAESASIGTILAVEPNMYASRQGWLLSNSTEPFVTSIVGFKDLCLQVKGSAVWIEECASNKIEQQWGLYADGTIRPQRTNYKCLTCNNRFEGATVIIINCTRNGWSSQRWMFKNDGTIMNVYSGLVMEVKESDLSLQQIIIGPPTGTPNQKWIPLL
ncbi:hypothetical protein Tsubulata_001701 [Turnera subulata]|uniref:Ribosome-inactivating protein n=1 Tax=Turnera subulata TaxID=218843 RepID=A0A9Q0FLW7_9ROSI|nr:hypothetical protein Tsubulata_001701 [Turnera subulata]